MNAEINVNVSVAVTASQPIARIAPRVILLTIRHPRVPYGRSRKSIPKAWRNVVRRVPDRCGFARGEFLRRIEARRLRAAPDLNCGHTSAQFSPLSSPL